MSSAKRMKSSKRGFTLIELSVTLVIIGLIIGGVLVGRDLIHAAEIRNQISQIEQYQTAVNTFKTKYNNLPGDIPIANATNFGFYRTAAPNNTGCDQYYSSGCGNGNGLIGNGPLVMAGESHLFWLDLYVAGLIKDSITTYNYDTGTTAISSYLPTAKLASQYIYVWEGGVRKDEGNDDYTNYFTISGINTYCNNMFGYGGGCNTSHIMKVYDAYSIDTKIDDGFPQSGDVLAIYAGYSGAGSWLTQALWVGASDDYGGPVGVSWGTPTTGAVPRDPANCYDNNGVNGTAQSYSMIQNGDAANCALSFKFK